MKKYIDFDGVILDTEPVLFEDYHKLDDPNKNTGDYIVNYIKSSDWTKILALSEELNNSLYYLKCMDPSDTSILTKIHSIKEGLAKILYLNQKKIKQDVILVPFYIEKAYLVDPVGNILIDDCVKNLDIWKSRGGIPCFYDKNANGIDDWNVENINHTKVRSLKPFI